MEKENRSRRLDTWRKKLLSDEMFWTKFISLRAIVINGRFNTPGKKKQSATTQSTNVQGKKESRRGHPHIAKNVSKGLKPEVIKQNTIGHVCGIYSHSIDNPTERSSSECACACS